MCFKHINKFNLVYIYIFHDKTRPFEGKFYFMNYYIWMKF